MARLTAAGRKRIKSSNFALPERRYPIHDKSHARNALARVSQHGTSSEKSKVRSAVSRRYPGIKQRKSHQGSMKYRILCERPGYREGI